MMATEFLSVFAGRRVMVTGHTGFKGSWLAFLLNEIGAEVLGYALPAEQKESHFVVLALDKSIRHVEGDVRDGTKLTETMAGFQPEFVFHLAAQALVRPSYTDPKATFETNVMGSVNLLEAVRQCESVRSLVYITSDKCYENLEWVWGYRENDRLGGYDPYSASKAAAEIAFSAYARSFFAHRPELGAATARAGNVIGGGDWALDRIVPDCIRAIGLGKPVVLRNPKATRPWQHVLEPLAGYLLLAMRLREQPLTYSSAWNFGPPSSEVRTVLQVAEQIVSRIGRGSVVIEPSEVKLHEANLLQLNCDKAHRLLGWKPRWNVEKTLEATADWYKAVMDGAEVAMVTRQQLRDYFPELK
ncbi:CDP-glucose 4,6-dehydratase [Sulfurirhabdus autotrophica]|uniref:CDP-glucose 4,6-dehydratase n=1 Tax=Sulfurirhabdus autotrophica TaxID=1706046 RepID=A0A4R3XYT6_9PROT|nr:CDP-glucose 4,6-dehydratase [Sulfurirhabdus autotrophica]TCV84272.1 CDP-glucose 4,6-dehydratase [Sulfurirhabdus autotrophica]